MLDAKQITYACTLCKQLGEMFLYLLLSLLNEETELPKCFTSIRSHGLEQIPERLCFCNFTEGLHSPGASLDLPYFLMRKSDQCVFFLRSSIEHLGIGPVQRPSGLEYGPWHRVQILVLSLYYKVTELSDLNCLGLDSLLYKMGMLTSSPQSCRGDWGR